MADAYSPLDQTAEDALHSSRLLNVEERPFKRISKRLLAPNTPLTSPPSHLPTPPPDAQAADEEAAARVAHEQRQALEREQWREELYLDFSAFEANIVRAQMVLDSNEQERARYAAEKDRIISTAEAVREGNAQLHAELEEAQALLALRKSYDEQAEAITSNRALKPREEQVANIEKLEAEIEALEREREEYSMTWAERREQFQRIVDEGMTMLRLIKDEKEEAERKEGMDDDAGDDTETPGRGSTGGAGTPRGRTPLHTSQTEDQDASTNGEAGRVEGDVEMSEDQSEEQAKAQAKAEEELEEGEDAGSEAGALDADKMETT